MGESKRRSFYNFSKTKILRLGKILIFAPVIHPLEPETFALGNWVSDTCLPAGMTAQKLKTSAL